MLDKLKIKIFADGADLESIRELNKKNYIKGFTTNPSLMKKAGIYFQSQYMNELLFLENKRITFLRTNTKN